MSPLAHILLLCIACHFVSHPATRPVEARPFEVIAKLDDRGSRW